MQNIHKVLIANRGEIACRIARTCRRLGLEVATVHSSADRFARHVREIGDSVALGGAAAADSYLNIEAVVAAAHQVGADAVHPGYGFLSENPDFVRAVEAAGLIFIGPAAQTMERLGGKANAKREAARLDVPVVPGSDGGLRDAQAVAHLVRDMELPVLLKAVAGGGGRGMAVIETLDGLDSRVESAMREAEQAFDSGELIVERYLPRVRHLEVQIAGDGQGRAMHLYERECTLQRRHQKIVEEAPAADLPPGLRERMLDDAVRLAAGVDYRGLGTVEFIVDGDEYFFLEVNPRLQVEHPVTEEVTGLDLVELQLRIASEGRLPLAQADISCDGHAVEVRLCAEDPEAGFLPATGRLEEVDFSRAGVRVDSGVESGDQISPHYDSMIAKLVAHSASRDAALQALQGALGRTTVIGVTTNLRFLQELLAWPETLRGNFHTRLIDERCIERPAEVPSGIESVPTQHLVSAALYWLAQRRATAPALGCWSLAEGFTGWRLGTGVAEPAPQPVLVLRAGGAESPIRYAAPDAEGDTMLAIGELREKAALRPLGGVRYLLQHPSRSLELSITGDDESIRVSSLLGDTEFGCTSYLGGALGDAAADGQLLAPMMGRVVALDAAVGDTVEAGQTLVVLESMKMELRVSAPLDGTVADLRCGIGDMVERHQVLGEVAAVASPSS